tara:strand:+ start:3161 stop:3664 length:504 start_codon:yes stop_codon:yes gene_type:complete
MSQYNVILQNVNNNIGNNIYERVVPSQEMQMNFGFRPIMSKYATMPILDNNIQSDVNINKEPIYNSETVFYPGTSKPHFNGFASNIDNESTLRNQFFALQRGDKHLYVPNSNSDLYENNLDIKNHNLNLDNLILFKKEHFQDFNPNISNKIGYNIFNNSTRVQLKNI